MEFFWDRPRPKFKKGQIVVVPPFSINYTERYLLIQRRRWEQGRWVYDGQVFSIAQGKLVWHMEGSNYLEDKLGMVPNFDYPFGAGYVFVTIRAE